LSSSECEQGWEETVVKQEQSDENQPEIKISLPSIPSLYIISFLFRACEEIHRIGGHVLDKSILQKFASRLLEKVCNWAGLLILLPPQILFQCGNVCVIYSHILNLKLILLFFVCYCLLFK
jgi:hypothetical protein